MSVLKKLLRYISPTPAASVTGMDPVSGYDLWSGSYDTQPDNLMLALDDKLFTELLNECSLKDKVIADIGCGTGRHWSKILRQIPRALIGFDVSMGMLDKLKEKFPGALTTQMHDNYLRGQPDRSCDIVVSTLTIAHIDNIELAGKEWHRVLKNGGELIITDYHPEALTKGGNRTFPHKGQTIAIENHIHEIDQLFELFICMGFEVLSFKEKVVDSSMRHFYEKKQALHVYDKFNNVPIIYGMHLKKKDAAT